jgi:hypothetical protein
VLARVHGARVDEFSLDVGADEPGSCREADEDVVSELAAARPAVLV